MTSQEHNKNAKHWQDYCETHYSTATNNILYDQKPITEWASDYKFFFRFFSGIVVTVIPSLGEAFGTFCVPFWFYTCGYAPLYSKVIFLNSKCLQCEICWFARK